MTQWGLDTLFNPAKRHMDEEKRRLQSTREEIGDSSGGKRIDLESGKVIISRPAPDPDSEADPATDDDEATVDRVAAAGQTATGQPGPAETATRNSDDLESDEHTV
jgi:hypothetical protein